jgi:hypothetical protein
MAITRASPGIQVEVLVEGEPLKEYDDEDEEVTADKVTKFIEAKSGSEFKIRWTITPSLPRGLCLFLHLHGRNLCLRCFRPAIIFSWTKLHQFGLRYGVIQRTELVS